MSFALYLSLRFAVCEVRKNAMVSASSSARK